MMWRLRSNVCAGSAMRAKRTWSTKRCGAACATWLRDRSRASPFGLDRSRLAESGSAASTTLPKRWRSPRARDFVILVDANILIYAHVSSFAQHRAARDWLDRQLDGFAPVGLPLASLLAFLRLVANPRVFEHAEPMADAWNQVAAWLTCETAWVPEPTERHGELLGRFLDLPGMHANLVP